MIKYLNCCWYLVSMKRLILGVLFISVLILGCTTPSEENTGLLLLKDDSKATEQGIENIVSANNRFAFDLYSALPKDKPNLFFSPYSISSAFSIAYEGAANQTATEIENVLGFPVDATERRSSFARMYNLLNKTDKEYQLYTANAFWAQENYPFLSEYVGVVEQYYDGNVVNVDFVNETESSRLRINQWVENHTNNRIKDLLPVGSVDSLTRLVITNTIFFKGDWNLQFDPRDTQEADFKVSKNQTKKVQLMSLVDEPQGYGETEEVQVLQLPYKGNEISMLVILPKEESLETIEKNLSIERLSEWKNALQKKKADVYLPKFKLETSYDLVPTLREMGMNVPFTENADFSGMSAQEQLLITGVLHKAFVEVNEEGTEAAAATGIIVGTTSYEPPTVFRADHPFIFIIQENSTGEILFLGRFSEPPQ